MYCGVERPINVETRVTKEEEAKEEEEEEEGDEEEDAEKEMEKEEDEVDRTVFRFVTLVIHLNPALTDPTVTETVPPSRSPSPRLSVFLPKDHVNQKAQALWCVSAPMKVGTTEHL